MSVQFPFTFLLSYPIRYHGRVRQTITHFWGEREQKRTRWNEILSSDPSWVDIVHLTVEVWLGHTWQSSNCGNYLEVTETLFVLPGIWATSFSIFFLSVVEPKINSFDPDMQMCWAMNLYKSGYMGPSSTWPEREKKRKLFRNLLMSQDEEREMGRGRGRRVLKNSCKCIWGWRNGKGRRRVLEPKRGGGGGGGGRRKEEEEGEGRRRKEEEKIYLGLGWEPPFREAKDSTLLPPLPTIRGSKLGQTKVGRERSSRRMLLFGGVFIPLEGRSDPIGSELMFLHPPPPFSRLIGTTTKGYTTSPNPYAWVILCCYFPFFSPYHRFFSLLCILQQDCQKLFFAIPLSSSTSILPHAMVGRGGRRYVSLSASQGLFINYIIAVRKKKVWYQPYHFDTINLLV